MVRLRYCESITLNPGIGGITSHVFSTNGMYDCNITGAGHQPHGFDQMMVGYDHYTVLGSKIKVTWTPETASEVVPAMFGVFVDDDSTLTYTDAIPLLESKQGVGALPLSGGTGNGNRKVRNRYFSSKKFFGKKYIAGSADYRGDTSNNPTEQAFFQVWAAAIAGNDPPVLNFFVELEFIAKLTEPKHIAAS